MCQMRYWPKILARSLTPPLQIPGSLPKGRTSSKDFKTAVARSPVSRHIGSSFRTLLNTYFTALCHISDRRLEGILKTRISRRKLFENPSDNLDDSPKTDGATTQYTIATSDADQDLSVPQSGVSIRLNCQTEANNPKAKYENSTIHTGYNPQAISQIEDKVNADTRNEIVATMKTNLHNFLNDTFERECDGGKVWGGNEIADKTRNIYEDEFVNIAACFYTNCQLEPDSPILPTIGTHVAAFLYFLDDAQDDPGGFVKKGGNPHQMMVRPDDEAETLFNLLASTLRTGEFDTSACSTALEETLFRLLASIHHKIIENNGTIQPLQLALDRHFDAKLEQINRQKMADSDPTAHAKADRYPTVQGYFNSRFGTSGVEVTAALPTCFGGQIRPHRHTDAYQPDQHHDKALDQYLKEIDPKLFDRVISDDAYKMALDLCNKILSLHNDLVSAKREIPNTNETENLIKILMVVGHYNHKFSLGEAITYTGDALNTYIDIFYTVYDTVTTECRLLSGESTSTEKDRELLYEYMLLERELFFLKQEVDGHAAFCKTFSKRYNNSI